MSPAGYDARSVVKTVCPQRRYHCAWPFIYNLVSASELASFTPPVPAPGSALRFMRSSLFRDCHSETARYSGP